MGRLRPTSTSRAIRASEPAVELGAGGRCLFEDVVEQPGGDDFIWLAVAAEQASDLDWMGDERRVVDLPVLTGVASSGEPQRGLRHRQPGEPAAARRARAAGSGQGPCRCGCRSVTAVVTPIARRSLRLRSPCRCSSDSSPGATTFPASMSWASFAFSAARPGVSTPDPAAWEIGSPPRPRRITRTRPRSPRRSAGRRHTPSTPSSRR